MPPAQSKSLKSPIPTATRTKLAVNSTVTKPKLKSSSITITRNAKIALDKNAITKTCNRSPFRAGIATPNKGTPAKATSKPAWKRRPPPEHSGVPVPEKMRILFEKLRREKEAKAAAAAKEAATTTANNSS